MKTLVLRSSTLLCVAFVVGIIGLVGCQQESVDPAENTRLANVQYSPWTSVNFTGSGANYLGTITAPELTQDVLDKADIRVYWKEGGRVLSLPYAQVLGGTTYSVHQRFYVGKVEFAASYALGAQQFRYVIITGGTTLPGGRQAAIDYTDYEAVKNAFNLPD